MLLPLLLACAPVEEAPSPGDDTAPPADTTSYYRDVQPVMQRACARCHTEGGVASSFDQPEDVVRLAPLIASYTASGYMPPAAPDPSCRDYQDAERFTISAEEVALLATWAEEGAPLGDPADEVTWDGGADTLAPFDATLIATTPYAPEFAGDGNDYRCFALDVGNSAAAFVTGMEAIVDNAAMVHHIVLFSTPEPITLDGGADPREGFACSGLGEPRWSAIGAWAPGANPTRFPEGMGIPLDPQAQLVLQMHYFEGAGIEPGATDQSGYGLLLADAVDSEVTTLPLGSTSFTIPAGDDDYRATERYPWRGEGQVLGVWPHMHLLGTSIEETITHDDGSETCLLSQPRWDYHNQVVANFVEPMPLVSGDTVKVTCHWDNSASNPNQVNDPPANVPFGELTTEEMCFVFTYVAM